MTHWPDDNVILYDGVCVFCSRWVRFVATHDIERRFRFTAIQSPYGTQLAQAFGIDPDDPDTNAVVHGGVAYFKSDAALTCELTAGLAMDPRAFFVRSRCATRTASSPKSLCIFGKYDECVVPERA